MLHCTDTQMSIALKKAASVISRFFFESKNSAADLAKIAFGAFLQSYRFNKYFENKKKDKEFKLETLSLMTPDVSKTEKEYAPLKILADNICFIY